MSVQNQPGCILLTAHDDQVWQGAYRLNLNECGRLLVIGRDPVKVVAQRLRKEGMMPQTEFKISFVNGAESVTSSIEKVLKL